MRKNLVASIVLTLTAFSAFGYRISFEGLMGADNPNDASFDQTTALTFAAPGAVRNFTFVGWHPAGITAGTEGDLTVTAEWESTPSLVPVKTNAVTFALGTRGWLEAGGKKVYSQSQRVPDGEAAVAPSGIIVQSGWRFDGWDSDFDCVTNDLEVNALYSQLPTAAKITVDWDATRGSVSGCSKTGEATLKFTGGKLTLRATAKKGYVFLGWHEMAADGTVGGELTSKAALVLDNTGKVKETATQAVISGVQADSGYHANFITAAEEMAEVSASVNGMALTTELATATNLTVGVYVNWPVASTGITSTAVAVSGLPSGLSFKKNAITGYPTAATKANQPKTVKLTVTTGGKNKVVYPMQLTVEALPTWAVGTFQGPSYADEGATATNGFATANVTTTGKLTLKQMWEGKSTSFAGSGFSDYDAEAEILWAELTAKRGKVVYTNEIALGCNPDSGFGVLNSARAEVWGYKWTAEPWKTLAKSFRNKKYAFVTETGATIALSMNTSGSVSVVGTFGKTRATASTYLLPQGNDDFLVFIYLSPRNLTPYSGCLKLHWNSGSGEFEDTRESE